MIGLITGIVASMAHVITGPDHLAAVTPLAIDSRKKSWIIGLSWGIGHTTGMLIIGSLFILVKGFLPVDKISAHSEVLVGIMLIAIGLWAIRRILRKSLLIIMFIRMFTRSQISWFIFTVMNTLSIRIISINMKKIGTRMPGQPYLWGLYMDSRDSATCLQFFLLLLYLPECLLFFILQGLQLAPF